MKYKYKVIQQYKQKGAFLNHLHLEGYQELHNVLRIRLSLSDTNTSRTIIW